MILKRQLYRKSLYDFVKDFWNECDPAAFIEGFLINYLCELFMWAVRDWLPEDVTQHFISDDELKKVIKPLLNVYNFRAKNVRNHMIIMPPRHMKSLIFNVLGPCWLFSMAAIKVASVSHTERLATDMNIMRQKVINSERWKNHFPDVYLIKDESTKLIGSHLGELYSINRVSFTGYGADIIINDDIISAEQARKNKEEMNGAKEYYRNTMPQRRNNPFKSCIFNVQQRLALNDVAGMIINDTKLLSTYTYTVFPAETRLPVNIIFPCSGKIWSRPVNDHLWPERFGDYSDEKIQVGQTIFETQYNQNPLTTDTGVVSDENIHYMNEIEADNILKNYDFIFSSHDFPVKETKTSDHLGSVLGVYKNGKLLIIDALDQKMNYEKGEKYVDNLADEYPGIIQVVEDAANGAVIIQRRQGTKANVIPFSPAIGSKAQRLETANMRLISKNVYFLTNKVGEPSDAIRNLIEKLLLFPYVDHDDVVDAFSMLVLFVFERLILGIFSESIKDDNYIDFEVIAYKYKITTNNFTSIIRENNKYKLLKIYYDSPNDTVIVKDERCFFGDEELALRIINEFAKDSIVVDATKDGELYNIFSSRINIVWYPDDRPLTTQISQLKLGFTLKRILINKACYNFKSDLLQLSYDENLRKYSGILKLKGNEGLVACLRSTIYYFKGDGEFYEL